MTLDMTNNRVPYGLLTDEEKAALHEHEKAGGKIEYWCGFWEETKPSFHSKVTYRTVPLPNTQDVITWDRLPDWVEWVERYADGTVLAYDEEPRLHARDWGDLKRQHARIDDFPGIVQIGTCDWKDSKQRRPK